MQELLKRRWLGKRPNLFRQISTRPVVDVCWNRGCVEEWRDHRGAVFIAITLYQPDGEDEQWTHPLVRRQRLTLEQSLLAF